MTDAFTGEIQLFGFDFAPSRWALCNGALIPLRQNPALFSLIGTTYGGDGRTTFQLPNFTGRASSSQGTGPGLSPRNLGETYGDNNVTLALGEIPAHSHALATYAQPAGEKKSGAPADGNWLTLPSTAVMAVDAAPDAAFSASMIGMTGRGNAHENRQPFLALNFCINLQGVFPSFQ